MYVTPENRMIHEYCQTKFATAINPGFMNPIVQNPNLNGATFNSPPEKRKRIVY